MKANIAGVFVILLLSVVRADAQTVGDALKAAKEKEGNADWPGAIAIYDAIIKQFPKEFPEAYAARAEDRSLADDDKGALADYNKALEVDNDPKNQVLNHDAIYRERAQVRADLGDSKGAIADYHLALKGAPGDSFTLADLAEVELNAGACANSNTDYSQAIALAKEPEVLYFENRGVARLCLNDIANSYSDFQAAAAMDLKRDPGPPLFSQTYLDAWAVGVKLGRKADADKALSDQLAATKDEDSIERILANYYLGRADMAAVISHAQTASKDNGDDAWLGFSYYGIGLKQMADGDDKAAIASFQKMLAAKHHFVNTQLEARTWIKLMGGGGAAKKKS